MFTIFLFSAGVGAAIYAIGKGISLKDAGLSLLYKIGFPYQISVKGAKLAFSIDITLINPSLETFTIDFPFVSILYKGSNLGNTQLKNQQYILTGKDGASSSVTIKGIRFEIPLLSFDILSIIKSLGVEAAIYILAWQSNDDTKKTEAINAVKKQIFSQFSIAMRLVVNSLPVNYEYKFK